MRAMHEWMSDNLQTPHIVVDARLKGVHVPDEHVKDGKVVLNISHNATQGLQLGNESVQFQARFGGVAFAVRIPLNAVLGIYAKETGQGIIFTDADLDPQPPSDKGETSPEKHPHLKVVR